ncbi:MAG: glycosyltransferase family 2 protein [Sphaerochaetaceae bacterium]|nr:glycosyltransferase family 2 protein [Sphaerochaetaceae bacterium]
MLDLSAIILTKNESKNIKQCIDSIKNFVERIVVIDSGSSDDTVKLSKMMGADVYEHPFENYSKQFNWGLDNTDIKTTWTLRIDADERFTPNLFNEVKSIINNTTDPNMNGIILEADLFFLGKLIKHGGSKKRKLMIFRTGYGRIENRNMDEHTILSEGYSVKAKNKFLHYDFKDLTFFIDKLNWYATREVQDYIDMQGNENLIHLADREIQKTRKKKFYIYYKFPMFFRSWLLFIYFYIFKLGFLDGREGFIYHYMYQRWYRCLVDSKIYENKKHGKTN